jgi:hypothetical protein
VTGASTILEVEGTFTDSTKNWRVNQWGPSLYSVKCTNPNAAAYSLGSWCNSNTANTFTYYYYGAGDAPNHLVFNVGDEYQIHKVNIMMDQCGRGKGDMLTDVSSSTVGTVTVLSSTITATSVAGFPNTGGDIYLQTHVTSPEGVKHYRVHYTGIRVRTFTGCMWDNISDSSGTVQSGSTILAQFISSGPNTGKQT